VQVQGEVIPEVKTHSLEEATMHKLSPGQEGLATRTVATEYDTAHTWEQQHEGGLGHRAKETVRGAAEVVGEKAVHAAEVVKDKAVGAQEALAETGHHAREKIEGSLERNFGGTAEKIHAEGTRIKESALEDTAHTVELVREQLGIAAESLKDQERTEAQKSEAEKLQQYHSSTERPLDRTVDHKLGHAADRVLAEGQRAKEGAIHETAHIAELLEQQAGNLATALRDQQHKDQQAL